MRVAYADPPYPGKARKLYGEHPDFAGEVDHAELIDRLEDEFDAWALSTSAKALPMVLRLCPPMEPNPKQPGDFKTGTGVRVLSWHRRAGQPGERDLTNVWEPVIVRNYRRPEHEGWRPFDALELPPDIYGGNRPPPPGHVPGAKPRGFCRWLFDCMGLEPDDELVDLFPGTGVVLETWEAYRREERMKPPAKRSAKDKRRDWARDHVPMFDG